MARKKEEPKEPAERPTTASPPAGQPAGSKLADWSATEQARIEQQKAAEAAAAPTPEEAAQQERTETIAERLSGTNQGRKMLAAVLSDGVEKIGDTVEEYLAKLEGYAEGIDTVTAEDGTEYALITLGDLTGWRRRQVWKTLLGITAHSRLLLSSGFDIATVAGEIAGGDKGIELLGYMFGPVGVPYDKTKAVAYGEAVDDVLTTKQITGVILRFFSLNASVIARGCRTFLVSLTEKVTSFVDEGGETTIR